MKLLSAKVLAPTLVITAVVLIGGVTLVLHMTRTAQPAKQTTNATTPTKASPAQLAADEAAYKASAALMTQLCNASDQDGQATQTALDTYGDTSPQYQAAVAKGAADEEACTAQTQDAISKSLQVTTDGGTPGN